MRVGFVNGVSLVVGVTTMPAAAYAIVNLYYRVP
jgi:hypothetical protein